MGNIISAVKRCNYPGRSRVSRLVELYARGGRIAAGGGLFAGGPFAAGLIASGLNAATRAGVTLGSPSGRVGIDLIKLIISSIKSLIKSK